MKALVTTISICLAFLLLGSGCSEEEPPPPPPPVRDFKVVKPIVKPTPAGIKTSIASEEETAKPEEKEEMGVKTATIEEKTAETPETGATEQATPEMPETGTTEQATPEMPETGTTESEQAMEEAGYYIVKKGDSLSSISGREDVYGDPLKWPIICRLNMDSFGNLELGENFPDRELPERVRLKIITPDEARENLKKRANSLWVVNVISATNKGDVVPPAIRLIKNGYPAYLTKVKVKGKEWMRLRVGFFKNKAEADAEGQKIMGILNFTDSWTTKIGKKEFEEFGGY